MRTLLARARRPAPAARAGRGARRRADPPLSSATSRSRRTARSTSPRRSTSGPRTIGSTTASSATSRPAIAARNGSQVRVGFTFEGATLDGQPVPASDRARRQRRPDQDRRPRQDRRRRRAPLRHPLSRRRGRSAASTDYDELYWNATGNGWIFPIDVAEARIRLPEPVKFGQRAVYTGPQGSTASNAEVVDEKPGEITFRTTQPLGPYEGLTVAVAFPKGVVAEPSEAAARLAGSRTTARRSSGCSACSACCGFYYVAWQRAGRDPRAGTVVPIFSPPDDLRPPACATSTKMSADNRAFAAALVDMGVRGHIRLVEEDGGWLSGNKTRLERLDGSQRRFPHEEEAALDELCATRRIDRDGAEEPRRSSLLRRSSLSDGSEGCIRRQDVHAQLRLGGCRAAAVPRRALADRPRRSSPRPTAPTCGRSASSLGGHRWSRRCSGSRSMTRRRSANACCR